MIYMLLTDGFEEIEAIETLDILRRAGLNVKTVGVSENIVVAAHGVKIYTDILLDDVDKSDIEMLILPGGPGHENLDNNVKVHELIDYCTKNDIYLCAICAAPSILGKKGLTKGKKVTCFPGYEQFMTDAEVIEEKAVCDGKIITAKGAGAASDFGFLIVEKLLGKNVADKVKSAMQY